MSLRTTFQPRAAYRLIIQLRNFCFCATAFSITNAAQAGSPDFSKEMPPTPTVTSSEPWHFNLGIPGWLAGASGDIGLHGVSSSIDVGFDQILRHIDWATSVSLEVRKGRFGVYSDLLYLEDSAAIYNNGMLSKVNIGLSEYIVNGEVFYRVLDDPRGYLDLRAGGRYFDMYSSTKLFGNSRLIDQAATDLANAIDSDLKGVLERLLKHRLDGNNPPLPVPPLTAGEKIKLLKLIRNARMDPITAQTKIATVLNRELNRSFSLTERWVDPYIGIGGRYNLTKVYYLTGKADVGGFGVASDITAQAYGGLGCQITRNVYVEAGYRVLYYDYNSGGFLFKTTTQGAQITMGVTF
jgi:hypothetical protein